MTAKEKVLVEAPSWSERDAEVALQAVEREHSGRVAEDWGDLDAQTDAFFADSMKDLAEEERAGGFGPWEREPRS
jgi:hypothetical protein